MKNKFTESFLHYFDFRDGRVDIAEDEIFIVPKGSEHKPFAEKECKILLIESKGVVQ